MYDKFRRILRIETTTLDIACFKHYRQVQQRDGTTAMKFAPMKKSIYSLGALREVLTAANRRYLEFISAIDDPSDGIRKLNKLSQTVRENQRSYRGFNLFDEQDDLLLRVIARGEFNITGFQNKRLRAFPARLHQQPDLTPLETSAKPRPHQKGRPLLQILPERDAEVAIGPADIGRQVIALGLKLKNLFIIPELAQPAHA